MSLKNAIFTIYYTLKYPLNNFFHTFSEYFLQLLHLDINCPKTAIKMKNSLSFIE
jgi:hypothetical protein